MPVPKRASIERPHLWIAAISLAVTLVLAFDLLPFLRGTAEWAWEYKPVSDASRVAPLILGSIIYVLVGLWLIEHRTDLLLIWAAIGGIGLAMAAVNARGEILFRLFSITVSGLAEGWHMAATRIVNVDSTLRNWPDFMRASAQYSAHVDHTPPGIVLFYYGLSRLLDKFDGLSRVLAEPVRWQLCQYLGGYSSAEYASAWAGILMPVWSSLAVFPIQYLGRQTFGAQAGRLSAFWWPLLPSFLIFTPLPNTFYPIPALCIVALLWKALLERRRLWALGAGALMAFAMFFTFTYAPLAIFLGLLVLAAYFVMPAHATAPRLTWISLLQTVLVFLAGFLLPWLAVRGALGLDIAATWQAAQDTQAEIAGLRSYWPWVALSLNDFALFTGWPLSLLAMVVLRSAIQNGLTRRSLEAGEAITLAAALTVLLIALYGTPRGETGRILLILAPWVLFAAAHAVQQQVAAVRLFTALQALAAVVIVVCLQGITSEFQDRAAPVMPVPQPPGPGTPRYTSGAVFAQTLRLESVAGIVTTPKRSGGQDPASLGIWLTWEPLEAVDTRFSYLIELDSPRSGAIPGRGLVQPFAASYPTTCWNPADGPLTDRINIPIIQPSPGDVWMELSLVDKATGEGGGTRVRLGPFH